MSDYEPPMPIMKAVAASISQNTEQNVRTREDREQEIAILLCKTRGSDPFQMTYQTIGPGVTEPYGEAWCHYLDEAKAVLDWHEAEQRRKDAAGQEPVAWQVRDMRGGTWTWKQCSASAHDEYKKHSTVETRALYTRPANVAALKARIAELEEAATDAISLIRNGRPVLARSALQRVTTDRAALTREGGV